MSRQHHENRERLMNPDSTTVFMPELSVMDLPYVSILWGAFNPDLFASNRDRLLGLRHSFELTHSQREMLGTLSGEHMMRAGSFFQKWNQWSPAETNIIHELGLSEVPDLTHGVTQDEFVAIFKQRLQKAKGDVTLMCRPHSALYPTHLAVREEMPDKKKTKVAEIIFDKHIDTVINPGIHIVTSGNVYNFLTREGYLVAPIVLGPDRGLIGTYIRRGEDKKIPRVVATEIAGLDSEGQRRSLVKEILNGLKKWGTTNVTFTVDLDVFAPSEGVFAVRYSPITAYLGLGCQVLPENLTPKDIVSLNQILYPTPQVQYLLQEDQIRFAQQLSYVRQNKHSSPSGSAPFSSVALSTDIGMGKGARMEEVLGIMRLIKEELPKYGIQDGIMLKSGGRYRGAVVEMFGYEDGSKKTSRAAIRMNRAIAS